MIFQTSSTDGYDRSLILKNYTENIIIPAFNKLESDIINLENSIVEFSYNPNDMNEFFWSPLRSRNTKVPNDFNTALNVWSTINKPITTIRDKENRN